MATVFSANKELGLTTELIRFFACLTIAIALAAGTVQLMSKQTGKGATWATQRAQTFASWYCHRTAKQNPSQSCNPHLEDMRLLPNAAHSKAADWRFRFALSPGRGITIRVNEAGRVRMETPPTPW
jgi:hypothetical protein